jgi:hypothetical protein
LLTCGRLAIGPFSLIRKHAPQLRLVGVVRYNAPTQFTFPRARLRSQNVAGKCVPPGHLAGACLLEAFGRTFMCLELGHGLLFWDLLSLEIPDGRKPAWAELLPRV